MDTWIHHQGAYIDFLSQVLLEAPDFEQEDYLEPHEQLDMDKAFAMLVERLILFPRLQRNPQDRLIAEKMIEHAKKAFETGEILEGTTSIQELREFLRGKRPRRPPPDA